MQSFPNGQLGSGRDMTEAVASGALTFTTDGAAALGQFLPQLSVIEAPYLWRDAAHMAKVGDSPIFEGLNKDLVAKRGMRMLAVTYYGKRHLTSGSKQIRSVADMAGFKLRVPPVDTFRAMAEAWGARATPVNFNELYLALSQGAVDGQENPLPTIQSAKLNEVQKFLVLTGHIITPRLVIANEEFLKKLSDADRGILMTAINDGADLAGQGARRSGRPAHRHAEEGRHDGDRARRRELPQAGARQGAGAVREQVGQGHLGQRSPRSDAQPARRPGTRPAGALRRAGDDRMLDAPRSRSPTGCSQIGRGCSRCWRCSPACCSASSSRQLNAPLAWTDEMASISWSGPASPAG